MATKVDNGYLENEDDAALVPKTMAEALEFENPAKALRLLSASSQARADKLSNDLLEQLEGFSLAMPDILKELPPDHPIHSSTACADSIFHSLTKIASGGSQASQEIRQLEQEKRDLDDHAASISQALELRQYSDRAVQALQAQSWLACAEAIRPWLDWKDEGESKDDEATDARKEQYERCRAYTGEYALQQLSTTHSQLKNNVLQLYQQAVQRGDLKIIGDLTPVLSLVSLDKEAVSLYLQFLKATLQSGMEQSLQQGEAGGASPPYAPIARVYNAAVQCLRHHLPLVSHCLYKADGDAAVVQLVHVQVEEHVLPLLGSYQEERQLPVVSQTATTIYAALEERFAGRQVFVQASSGGTDAGEDVDDCGFSMSIGTLSDVDAAMEEVALCIQHCESYLRFIQHTCSEVNNARQIRFNQVLKAARLDKERQGWASGRGPSTPSAAGQDEKYEPLQILPPSTSLDQAVTELGGQYAGIERCLLLASLQRAFVSSNSFGDPRHYRPLGANSASSGAAPLNQALQTIVVDTCLYAVRRSAQRSFATGHASTACAMTNFAVDCLTVVLLDVLSHRAEESGVAHLKPGEGLLIGTAGLFATTNTLMRHTGSTVGVGSATASANKELQRKQETTQNIARACATLNDLEVACYHSSQLETLLSDTIENGFPPNKHETEQLKMCVKSLRTVTESFSLASSSAVESLESVLRSRIRSIVGEAVGAEGSGSAGFMGSSVMGGGKSSDRVAAIRMNYNLDDEAYNLQQLSEGYVARLSTLLDDLLNPLRTFLAPRLWDTLLCSVLATVSKRLETSLRKCEFTSLGALALDSDMRDLLSYAKDRFYQQDGTGSFSSNLAITRACLPLARLLQIAKLLTVDHLDDVIDLINSAKRKNQWDLKLEDTKAFLSARVEFEASQVNEVLRLPTDD